MCVYRSPSSDFCYFIKQLQLVLNKLYKVSTNTVLRGDFNINFLEKSSRIILLESLLASFSLDSTAKFPTRNVNNSHTFIDNIFIDKNRFYSSVHPLINGSSDHDAQIVVLLDILYSSHKQSFSCGRPIDDNSVHKFIYLLSFESWDAVFQNDNVNIIFNNFLDSYLRIFYTCFPIKRKARATKPKPWLTTSIKVSCANKRKLYETYRCNKDPNFKLYYKKYCRTLMSTIVASKKR